MTKSSNRKERTDGCRAASQPGVTEPGRVRAPIAIAGVPFDNVTLEESLGRIEEMIAQRRPHCVVTANVDFVVQARGDVELHRIFCDADLVLCDGTPLVWAARWLGNPLPERVAGADLVPRLIGVAAQKGYRLFFLGATPESSDAAVARLRAQYPDLIIAGHYSPPFKQLLDMDHKEIRRRIRAAKPDLLFVSFGCPKQEKWVTMHYLDLKVPVSIGVGATIDFLAGRVRRAPLWMQRTGTEWLFRLAQEPRRLFRRYLKDLAVFAWCLLNQCRLHRSLSRNPARNPSAPSSASDFASAWAPFGPGLDPSRPLPRFAQAVQAPDCLTFATAPAVSLAFGDALVSARDCFLDVSNVRLLDATGVALLVEFRKNLKALGLKLILVAPSCGVRRVLEWMHLDHFFIQAADLVRARRLLETELAEEIAPVSVGSWPGKDSLEWHGEITAANAALLWDQTRVFLAALPALGAYELDLSRVRFIDSSGLGLMIRAKKFARAQQKELLFTNPCAAVQNVLRLAKLDNSLLGRSEEIKNARLDVASVPAGA